jgi:hypothetical protein
MGSKYVPREVSADIHPQDVYTPEMHEVNLELVRDYMSAWGTELDGDKQATPWLMTDHGLARLQSSGESYRGDFVETRQKGYYALAAHFVKHTVEIDPVGLEGKSKIYPPIHQFLSVIFMNQPISPGMLMGYPTVRYNPRAASDTLTAHLHNPEQQTEVKQEDLSGLFVQRPIALRHWVRVKV